MNKDKKHKTESEQFFGESKKHPHPFNFYATQSAEETMIPGLYGYESMPYLKMSEGDIKKAAEKVHAWKSKSDAKIHDDYGFLERDGV